MSVKKGDDGSRFVEMIVELPGTPEEVWAAIATGPGISSWFTPTSVEERVDGAITFELGPDMASSGRITTWAPPHQLAYEERDWMEGAPPLATEVHGEARDGGVCVMRMVHSLFASDEAWDEQLESMENGWPPFFVVLREYMTHYRNLPCTSVRLMAKSSACEPESWEKLKVFWGLSGLAIGAPFQSGPSARVSLGGSVMQLGTAQCPHQAMLRLKEPGEGFATLGAYSWGGDVLASASFYFYGSEASAMAAAHEAQWAAWYEEWFQQSASSFK
jgi:uncharacterized protein YndB with AHSA1/START domain